MFSKSERFLTGSFSWLSSDRKSYAAERFRKSSAHLLLFLGMALLFSVSPAAKTMASENPATEKYEDLDTRWLPWIGSWSLESTRVNTYESLSEEGYFLTLSPGSNGNSVNMKGLRGDEVLVDEEIIADGLRHPLKDEKCQEYYMYSWSETGKRLLLDSESRCPDEPVHHISGMSIIDENGDWLDIQSLIIGAEETITTRKYTIIDRETIVSSRFNPDQVSISRIAASKNFSISEIIELSSKVEVEVLETALFEIGKPFPINSRQLVKLSDSGVPSRITDLMVALSFPDKFTVERDAIYILKESGPRKNFRQFYYPYAWPVLPWHWASSCYPYGYYYGCYYPFWPWWPPPPTGGGGSGVRNSGKLVKGHGYIKINPGKSGSSPRRARPRNAPAVQNAPTQANSSASSVGSSSSYSGTPSIGSTTTGSGTGYPTASPNGYSSGGH